MAGLSNIFGGGDSDSATEHQNDSSLVDNATSAVGLEYSDNSSHNSQDADGSSTSSTEGHNFGFNENSDNLLNSVTHALDADSHSSAN